MPTTMNEVLHPRIEWSRDPSFPDAPELWTPREGRAVAARLGVRITEAHWEVVRALQSWFASGHGANVRSLHDALEERYHQLGGRRYLYTLFPGGPLAQGCRIGGLTPPPGSVDPSFGSVQ